MSILTPPPPQVCPTCHHCPTCGRTTPSQTTWTPATTHPWMQQPPINTRTVWTTGTTGALTDVSATKGSP